MIVTPKGIYDQKQDQTKFYKLEEFDVKKDLSFSDMETEQITQLKNFKGFRSTKYSTPTQDQQNYNQFNQTTSKSERFNQSMRIFQMKRTAVKVLVNNHLTYNPFPITQDQIEEFFSSYEPKSDSFDKATLENDSNFIIEKKNDAIYYGVQINNMKHGKGILLQRNGRLYEGGWENNYKHGKGFEIFQNGAFYKGQYVNGKPEGIGTYEWPNEEIYEGQWLNGLKHGSGIWKGNKGDSYIGEWKSGKADGYGVHIWVNGDRYEGQFKECLKWGQGQERFANGDTYIGSYENGKPHGKGEYYYSNGAVYFGDFQNGMKFGKGVWQRGTGMSDKYEGNYDNDMKHGLGTFIWADGSRYQGQFWKDLRHGYGEMIWADGSIYKGVWKQGIQNGEGIMMVENQNQQEGVFLDATLIEHKKVNLEQLKNQAEQDNNTISEVKGETQESNQSNSPQKINKKKLQPISEVPQKLNFSLGISRNSNANNQFDIDMKKRAGISVMENRAPCLYDVTSMRSKIKSVSNPSEIQINGLNKSIASQTDDGFWGLKTPRQRQLSSQTDTTRYIGIKSQSHNEQKMINSTQHSQSQDSKQKPKKNQFPQLRLQTKIIEEFQNQFKNKLHRNYHGGPLTSTGKQNDSNKIYTRSHYQGRSPAQILADKRRQKKVWMPSGVSTMRNQKIKATYIQII